MIFLMELLSQTFTRKIVPDSLSYGFVIEYLRIFRFKIFLYTYRKCFQVVIDNKSKKDVSPVITGID